MYPDGSTESNGSVKSMKKQAQTEEMDLQGGPYLFIKSPNLQKILMKVHLERYVTAHNWLAEHFQGRPVRILDLACGTGYGSKILSALSEVIGVDISHEVITHANQHQKTPRTTFMVGDAENPKFLDGLGRFDAVVSLATIEHLEDHSRYIHWVRKSLKREGVFVVSFPSTFTRDWNVDHLRDISRQTARDLFRDCGFDIKRTFYQADRLPIRTIIHEARTNEALPAPPLGRWVAYYLRHPDHMARRAYQIIFGGGVLFEHQQYLLSPAGG